MGTALRRYRAFVRAAASAFAGTGAVARRQSGAAPPEAEPRGVAHMWAIVAGTAEAEQVRD